MTTTSVIPRQIVTSIDRRCVSRSESPGKMTAGLSSPFSDLATAVAETQRWLETRPIAMQQPSAKSLDEAPEQCGTLLSPADERSLAERIASDRHRYHRQLLGSDLVLRHMAGLLRDVSDRRVRLDRTFELWAGDGERRAYLLPRLTSCRVAIERMDGASGRDFRILLSPDRSSSERRATWRRMATRRRQVGRQVESMQFRSSCYDQPLFELLNNFRVMCRQIGTEQSAVDWFSPKCNGHTVMDGLTAIPRRHVMQRMAATRESPSTLARRLARILRLRESWLDARQRLALGNVRLVMSVARQFAGCGLELDDLRQAGYVGLLRAVDKFNAEHGCRFSTYATWWIRQAIARHLTERKQLIHLPPALQRAMLRLLQESGRIQMETGQVPTAEQLGAATGVSLRDIACLQPLTGRPLSLDQPVLGEESPEVSRLLTDHRVPPPRETAERSERLQIVTTAIAQLTAREQQVIELRFGIADGRARSLAEVGDCMRVSRETVRTIEKRAFDSLRSADSLKRVSEPADCLD